MKKINDHLNTLTIALVIAIVGLSVQFVNAQTTIDSIPKTKQIEDVVVTGQYGENSLTKSVYKVRLIDQKRIQLQGAFNLKDVLTNELNVRVTNDPSLGGSVSIQGISGQNVKIMIDGVPMIGREGGFIDLNQINLNNIERIELIEGPMSVSFGTDALGGVINLITKKDKKNPFSIGANSYLESIGQYNFGLNASSKLGNWNIDMSGARNFFEGFSQQQNVRFKQWKPRTQYMADAAVGKILKNGSTRYTFSFFDEKVTNRDSGIITPYFAYANDQYIYSRRVTNSFFIDKKISKNHQYNIVASYNHYRRIRNTVRKDLVTLEEQMVPSLLEHDTNYFNAWMSRGTLAKNKPKASLNYQVGYELNYEKGEGKRILNGQQTIADVNAFGSTEIKPLNRLTIRPGVRVIYNTKYNAPIVPSVNIKYDINSIATLRASYGRGFRAPSLKELYLDFVDPSHNVKGNTNLTAEKQHNYQLSALMEWKKFEHIFTVEPAFFYNDIQNKIDLVLRDAATLEAQYDNIGSFKNIGVNVSTAYKAPKYSFVIGYAYTGINNSLMALQGNNQFFYTHEFRSNVNYEFTRAKLIFSVFYKYNGRIQNYVYDITNGSIKTGFVDAFGLLDATLNKSFFAKKMTITAGSKNILNIKNVAASIPNGIHSNGGNTASIAMGRTAFLSIAYNLSWIKK